MHFVALVPETDSLSQAAIFSQFITGELLCKLAMAIDHMEWASTSDQRSSVFTFESQFFFLFFFADLVNF